MPLPPEKIDEIRAKADLLAVARTHTAMRKQGHNWVGCCPFHQERTPSFSVHPDKQLFYCFGCQRGGDVFAFVMQTGGVDFQTAVRQLAEQTHVELAPRSPAQARQHEAQRLVHATHAAAQTWLHEALWAQRHEAARAVRGYLAERGVSPRQARAFGLGFGADGAALRQALRQRDYAPAQLVEVGLLGEPDSLPWMTGRLTFPITDLAGNVVGFGARRLKEGIGPKYLNSRENAAFHKGSQLFGLTQAAPAIRQRKEVLLVEGYFDVLALHQAGAAHSVAALGTQLTAAHAEHLARLCTHATLLLDGDAAGLRASFKAAQVLLARGLQVQLVQLPKGEDPASLAQSQGSKALLQLLAVPEPAVASFVRRAFAAADASIEAKVAAAMRLMPLLDCLGGLEKTLYLRRVAEQVGVDVDELVAHWRKRAKALADGKGSGQGRGTAATRPGRHDAAGPRGGAGARGPARRGAGPAAGQDGTGPGGSDVRQADAGTRPTPPPPLDRRELALVRELLLFPATFDRLGEVAGLLRCPPLRSLLEKLATAQNPESALPALLTQCIAAPQARAQLGQIRPFEGKTLDEVALRANRTVDDILRRLRLRAVDDSLRAVLGELAAAEARGDATDALVRRKQQLTAEKRALRGANA